MAGNLLHVLHLFLCLGHGSVHDGLEEVVNCDGVTCHLVGQLEVCKGLVAQQLGLLCAKLENLKYYCIIVVLVGIVST